VDGPVGDGLGGSDKDGSRNGDEARAPEGASDIGSTRPPGEATAAEI
jgi:hypothetical protein